VIVGELGGLVGTVEMELSGSLADLFRQRLPSSMVESRIHVGNLSVL
jgi:hypothetical protein